MLLLVLDYNSFIITVLTVALTTISTVAVKTVRNHFKRREKVEKENQRRQELHFMKIDAVIYAIAASSDNVHSEIFSRKYDEQLKRLIRENKILSDELDLAGESYE